MNEIQRRPLWGKLNMPYLMRLLVFMTLLPVTGCRIESEMNIAPPSERAAVLLSRPAPVRDFSLTLTPVKGTPSTLIYRVEGRLGSGENRIRLCDEIEIPIRNGRAGIAWAWQDGRRAEAVEVTLLKNGRPERFRLAPECALLIDLAVRELNCGVEIEGVVIDRSHPEFEGYPFRLIPVSFSGLWEVPAELWKVEVN